MDPNISLRALRQSEWLGKGASGRNDCSESNYGEMTNEMNWQRRGISNGGIRRGAQWNEGVSACTRLAYALTGCAVNYIKLRSVVAASDVRGGERRKVTLPAAQAPQNLNSSWNYDQSKYFLFSVWKFHSTDIKLELELNRFDVIFIDYETPCQRKSTKEESAPFAFYCLIWFNFTELFQRIAKLKKQIDKWVRQRGEKERLSSSQEHTFGVELN